MYFVVLCEDEQHEVFLSRFLEEMKLSSGRRDRRIKRANPGAGAADQFVRTQYVKELKDLRKSHVNTALVVMVDGDRNGTRKRIQQLDHECKSQSVGVRSREEKVAIFVPTWCIETWFAYLDGRDVDEGEKKYPRLKRPRDCSRHVKKLAKMCRSTELRRPAPESLEAACREYNQRLK